MSAPMTAAQIVSQLKKWHITYETISGWETHNRNFKGPWGPVNGFIWHHTGADVSNAEAKSYAATTLYNGITNLPGPLCQFSIGLDGTVYLVGWGRANHAGGGDPAVLSHVTNEDFIDQLHPKFGNSNGVDGNAHFYGVEIQYSGNHPMSDAQYKTALRLSAAILDFHGWTEKSVIGHGEWSADKWDPGYAPDKIMAMPGVRADVKNTLANGPDQKEDDVSLTADQAKQLADIAANVRKVASNQQVAPWQYKGTDETVDTYGHLRGARADLKVLAAKLDAQGQTINQLVSTVAKLASGVSDLDPDTIVAELKAAIESITVHLDVPSV